MSQPPARPAIALDARSWLQGLRDAYAGRASQAPARDPLAYASGRVEGEAARLNGQPLAELLAKAKLPRSVATAGVTKPPEPA